MMVYTITRLTVQDYNRWRPVFDSLESLRQSYGLMEHHVFQGVDNPNDVTVLFQWQDIERARAYWSSPELKAGMAEAGVAGPPSLWFANEV